MREESSEELLYEKVRFAIKEQIRNGVYKVGDKILNEFELTKQLGVSRITVRRAIKELIGEGYLEIIRGKGTFIRHPNISMELLDISSFSERPATGNDDFTKEILNMEIIKSDDKITSIFEKDKSFDVLKLYRLVYNNKIPLSVDEAYLPVYLYPNIIKKIKKNVSTFKLMKEHYKVNMKNIYKEFTVVHYKEISELLKARTTEPVIKVNKVIRDEKEVIHYSQYYFLAKEVKFCLNINI